MTRARDLVVDRLRRYVCLSSYQLMRLSYSLIHNSAYPVDPGARRVPLRTQLRARRRRRRVLPARRAVQPDAAVAAGFAAARAAHGGDELGGPRERGGAAG